MASNQPDPAPGMLRQLRHSVLENARQQFGDPYGPGKNKYHVREIERLQRGPTADGFKFEHCFVFEVSR
jgi:hypothetical protein